MNVITKPIRYVFYRVLKWKLTITPADPTPMFTAVGIVTLLLIFNLAAIQVVINHLTSRSLFGRPTETDYILIVAAFAAMYYLTNKFWVANGYWSELCGEFEQLEKSHGVLALLFFWFYVSLSIASPIVLVLLWR
jgi:hypothetical protein